MAKSKILVVEDQPEFQRALTFRLKAQGYEVELAEDGCAADLCLGIGSYDVVLIKDVLSDGPAAPRLREWRHKGHQMPVILMLENAAAEPEQFKTAHADGVIARPFAISDLILEIERVTVVS
ncbi:MAG: response regulator [Planctomycetes bacterium]|nr:response regulator [Planctomycetota bacterium]